MATDSHPGYMVVIPWSLDSVGGVSEVARNLLEEIRVHGAYLPYLLVPTWEAKKTKVDLVASYPLIQLRLRSPVVLGRQLRGLAAFLTYLPKTSWQIYRILRRYKIACVNLHFPSLSSYYFVLLRTLGIYNGALVFSFHGTDVMKLHKKSGSESFWWTLILKNADAITTCSRHLASELDILLPSGAPKPVPIPNGVSLERLSRCRDKNLRLPKAMLSYPMILSVGTFVDIKGHDTLVKAFSKVLAHFPDTLLVLVGRRGPSLESVRTLVNQLRIDQRVFIQVDIPHEQIPAYMEAATLFAFPSRREAFGIAILEAGAFSKPVVASAVGGIPEILDDGKTGVLIASDSETQLAEALVHLLSFPKERAQLGRALHAHVSAHFRWDSMAKKYMQLAELE